MFTKQLEEDLNYTYHKLSPTEREKISDSTILITGCAGFLGFYILHFLYRYREELRLKQVRLSRMDSGNERRRPFYHKEI